MRRNRRPGSTIELCWVMSRKPHTCAKTGKIAGHFCAFALPLATALLTPLLAHAGQQNDHKGSMPGMDMSGKCAMDDMGPSMAAMAGHMRCITPLRPKEPGDEQKVKDVVAKLKATMDRYKDYCKALNDGYVIANPKLKQAQYHFLNDANTHEADLQFDPTKPTALLYRRTPMQEYKLEGADGSPPARTPPKMNSTAASHLPSSAGIATSTTVSRPGKTAPTTTRRSRTGARHVRLHQHPGGLHRRRLDLPPFIFTWMIHVSPLRNRL